MEVRAEVDRLEYAIVGLGMNANIDPNRFPAEWNATSISDQLGHEVSRTELMQEILSGDRRGLCKLGSKEIYEEWRSLSVTMGSMCASARSMVILRARPWAWREDGCPLPQDGEGPAASAGRRLHSPARLWRKHERKKGQRNSQGHPGVHPGSFRVVLPEEFAGLLQADDEIITEVLILPGTESSRMSALIRLYMLPNMEVAGSAHSHPSANIRPSEPDLAFFSRTGDYHIIVGPPFNEKSWACYDASGERRDLAVLDVEFKDDGFDDGFG